jgi:hypothetical protein
MNARNQSAVIRTPHPQGLTAFVHQYELLRSSIFSTTSILDRVTLERKRLMRVVKSSAVAILAAAAVVSAAMIPTVVRNSLPGLYQAKLALLHITRNAITNDVEIAEHQQTEGGGYPAAATVVLDGLAFLVRRPG